MSRRDNAIFVTETARACAREHGWAIGSHGSMERDIDLIAVPWRDDACSDDVLVQKIAEALQYIPLAGWLGARRPGGRRTVLLAHPNATYTRTEKGTWTPACVDLSVVDPRAPS